MTNNINTGASSKSKPQSNDNKKPGPLSSPRNEDLAGASGTHKSRAHQHKNDKDAPHNILFILTDQERYLNPNLLPANYKLPGRERLKELGISFTNHHISSAVCTSSRSVIYTGRHMPNTLMFDNLNFPWANELDTGIGTLGQLLGEAGYYAAYKGKWHLSDMEGGSQLALPDDRLTKVMQSYGFEDYVGIGDVIGMVQGGWINDDLITAQAQRWLRVRGNPMNQKSNDERQPWLLAVNLVNPHDVMFFNTDAPDEHIQDTPPPLIGLSHEPNTPFYEKQWNIKLPESRKEPFDKEGRPTAHLDYQISRDTQVGAFPNEDVRWHRLLNYYYNCIKATDDMVMTLIDEIEDLGLLDSTIIVLTSDHGELGGSHANHGKGTTVYDEQNHVPLFIAHPDYWQTAGQDCNALTSHLDIASTMLAWSQTGANNEASNKDADKNSLSNKLKSNPKSNQEKNKYLKQPLNGKDLTQLLALGNKASINEIREGVLFCFNMFAYLDRNFMTKVQEFLNDGGDPKELGKQKDIGIDFNKRGAIRSVFDGRYKFSRYFSPKQHNQPTTLAEIFELNDIELFDLQHDPDEMHNLAIASEQNEALILKMNAKLNKIITDEIDGADDGSFLPLDETEWSERGFNWEKRG